MNIFERLLLLTEKEIEELWEWLIHHHKRKHVRAVFIIKYKYNKFTFMALTLTQGQTDVVGIQVIDSLTGNILTQAALSGQNYAIDDATIVAAVPDTTDPTSEDLTASTTNTGTANLTGSVTADLSAYGLGVQTLQIAASPINVIAAAPQIAPQAQFVFGNPQAKK